MTKMYFQNLTSEIVWQNFENFPNFFRNFKIFIFQIDFSKIFFRKKKLPKIFSRPKKIRKCFFEKSIWKMKFSNFRFFLKKSKTCQIFFRWKKFSMKKYLTNFFWSCISIPNFPKIPKIALRKISDELRKQGAKSRSKVYTNNLFFAELFISFCRSAEP